MAITGDTKLVSKESLKPQLRSAIRQMLVHCEDFDTLKEFFQVLHGETSYIFDGREKERMDDLYYMAENGTEM
jgi:hypothetical protein